jgi:hypothetical protein
MDGKGIIIINYFLHHNIFRSLFYFGTLNRLETSKIIKGIFWAKWICLYIIIINYFCITMSLGPCFIFWNSKSPRNIKNQTIFVKGIFLWFWDKYICLYIIIVNYFCIYIIIVNYFCITISLGPCFIFGILNHPKILLNENDFRSSKVWLYYTIKKLLLYYYIKILLLELFRNIKYLYFLYF